MRLFSWRFVRVWQRNRDVFLRLWPSEVPVIIAEPLIVLLLMGFGMGAFVGDIGELSYIEYIAPGLIASYTMFSASFECTYGSFVRMEFQRTFDAIITTPLSVEDVIAGEIFWGATRATLTGTAILAVAAAFGLVPSPWAIFVPLLCFVAGLMFAGFAMLVTSLAPSINSFNYFITLFVTPQFFFSGIFFPLTAFPAAIQKLSCVVPLTPVVNLSRALVRGDVPPDNLWQVAVILGWGLLLLVVALRMMRRRLIV